MFNSFVLGEVSHPVNILKEFLAAFCKRQKVKASILSYIDGWHVTGHEWVRVSIKELAEHLGYCNETISRHLVELVNQQLIERTLAKWWCCDRAYKYRINRTALITALGASPIPEKSDHGNSNFADINTDLHSDLESPNTKELVRKEKNFEELDEEAIKRIIAEAPFMQPEEELQIEHYRNSPLPNSVTDGAT